MVVGVGSSKTLLLIGMMNYRSINFRPCTPENIPEILRIQEANFVSNLSKDDRKDGYLSIEFHSQQLEEMNREIPLIVADLGEKFVRLCLCY